MNSMADLINFLPGTVSASAITHVVTAPYKQGHKMITVLFSTMLLFEKQHLQLYLIASQKLEHSNEKTKHDSCDFNRIDSFP